MRVDFAVYDAFDDAEGAPVASDLKPHPPHFAVPGSLEFDFALRWRELALAHEAERDRLSEVHRQEREVLRQEQVRARARGAGGRPRPRTADARRAPAPCACAGGHLSSRV